MTIQDFIKKRKHLIWYAKDYAHLSAEAIVEAVLNYGNWDDVQGIIKIMGINKVAEIFRRRSTPDKFGRQNYRERSKYYFSLYFDKYAPA